MTFEEALKSCKKENFGELASITSNDLQTAINDERKKNDIQFMWIGLKKEGKICLILNDSRNDFEDLVYFKASNFPLSINTILSYFFKQAKHG